MANPMSAFQGVNASTDAQKAALGQFIAQQGSAGVESWKAEQAVGQQAAADARAGVIASNPGIGQPNMGSAVGPGQLTQMLAQRAAAPGQLMAQQGAQASADFGAYTGLLGQANSNYGDAVKGAAPIVESQTRSKVAEIQAELAAKRMQMQQEADDRAQARADAQRERDWATQDRMLMLSDQQRERGWAIDDRNAKIEADQQANAAPGSAMDAAKTLGIGDKTRDRILSSKVYQDAKVGIGERLMPGMSQAEVEGLIRSSVKKASGDKGGNSAIISLLAEQYRHLTGEDRIEHGYQSHLADVAKKQAAAAAAARNKGSGGGVDIGKWWYDHAPDPFGVFK